MRARQALALLAARVILARGGARGRPTEDRDTDYAAHAWVWLDATTRLSGVVVPDPGAAGTWNVIEEWTPAARAPGW